MISSLTLQGFKSFAERTRLEFGPGITVVIGPNGSGKSNVVEALRWVSHQARARELRAARATELIFHGSAGENGAGGSRAEQPATGLRSGAGKAPLGLAEVQVELRTSAGERLHLARRIYRDGTAEQDIMGRSVRARDVQSALRGTGLGSGGLAVIGQGEVGGVIQAEGPTLLAYVQEAAGLSRSVAARQETEAGLRAAETQLAQVRLLETELEGRVRRLHLAAAAASRYRTLSLHRLHLQDALVRARHMTALGDLLTLRQRVTELEQETQALGGLVVKAATDLELARSRVAHAREQSQAHTQTVELLRAAARSEQQLRSTLEHLERDLADTVHEQERLNLLPPPEPAPVLADLQTALAAVRNEQAASNKQARELEVRLRLARERSSREAQQQAALGAQQNTLQTELTGCQNSSLWRRQRWNAAGERRNVWPNSPPPPQPRTPMFWPGTRPCWNGNGKPGARCRACRPNSHRCAANRSAWKWPSTATPDMARGRGMPCAATIRASSARWLTC